MGQRCRHGCQTRTRDTSARAYDYLCGQPTMDHERNLANMVWHMTDDDGHAVIGWDACQAQK